MKYYSWGRLSSSHPRAILHGVEQFDPNERYLVVGERRSYGDSCFNDDGVVIFNRFNDSLIAFDPEHDELTVESGATLADLIHFLIPRGYFLPVVPGTSEITVGGAIANDIHGKNHHCQGTFGHFVTRFSLRRSDGLYECSPNQNPDLYYSTIGGLGLTGLIENCTLKLKRITSSFVDAETIKFSKIDEFYSLCDESIGYEYSVAWIDNFSFNLQEERLRGHFIRGNHSSFGGLEVSEKTKFQLFTYFPNFVLNRLVLKVFNLVYYYRFWGNKKKARVAYDSFFFPLDVIKRWNLLYGKRGFYQFQCVLPIAERKKGLIEILNRIAISKQGSFLAVLKQFGSIKKVGMLSFPDEGVTLALDFPNNGEKTIRLLKDLYDIVGKYDGKIYPAKDLLLGPHLFLKMYPSYVRFLKYKDPLFSSNFEIRIREEQ